MVIALFWAPTENRSIIADPGDSSILAGLLVTGSTVIIKVETMSLFTLTDILSLSMFSYFAITTYDPGKSNLQNSPLSVVLITLPLLKKISSKNF